MKLRIATIFGLVVVGCFLISCGKDHRMFFDLPAGSGDQTLADFATQSAVQIIYNNEEVETISTNRVYGKFTCDEALAKMLHGTALHYVVDKQSGAIAVGRRDSPE